MKKKIILFLCSGNTCRSPVAEYIFNSEAEKKKLGYTAISAGVFACNGMDISANSRKILIESGIKKIEHKSRALSKKMVEDAELVICMTVSLKNMVIQLFPEFADKIKTLKFFCKGTDGDISDPFGRGLEDYRHCGKKIHKCIMALIERIL